MNTKVIIIMIVCATVISLVAIICDHLFERKTDTSENYPLAKKIIKIHRNYIAGILGFAVIMLITARYGGPENAIFTYLSFASTITSFVLSILAIFVTVQSSSDLYKQFARIDDATGTIRKYSEQIDGTTKVLKEAGNNLRTTAYDISEKLDNIVEQLDKKMRTQVKETENKILEEMKNISGEKVGIETNQSYFNAIKSDSLNLTSGAGLLALYTCALSKENKNKMFDLSYLFNKSEKYIQGFLVASDSFDVVRLIDKQEYQFICIDSRLSSIEVHKEIEKRKEEYGIKYWDKVNKIRTYFGLDEIEYLT